MSGQYGYRGYYFDLPAKEGYSIYDIGDIFMHDDEYCLSAVYAHYDEKSNECDYLTDIFTIDLSGNVRYILEISKMQVVRAVFEKEYAFFAYPDSELAAVQQGLKDPSELQADLVFFDKGTGDTTRVIHPKSKADAVFTLSDGFIIVGQRNLEKYSHEGELLSEIATDFTMYPSETSIFEDSGEVYLVSTNDNLICDYYRLDFSNKRTEHVVGSDEFNSDIQSCSGQYFFGLKGEYKVNLKEMQIETMALWNDIDIRPERTSGSHREYAAFDETHFAQKTLYPDGTAEVGFFTYESGMNQNKTRIVVGGYGVYTDKILQWAVYNFNTRNDEFRIVLEDYSDEFSSSTPQEAQTVKLKLMKYFSEGNAPDIFYGDSFDYEYFGHAGMIMDLMPFFEKDSQLRFQDLVPSVQTLMLPDDEHCYSIFSSFITSGYWGLRSDFDSNQVSVSDLQRLCEDSDKRFTSDQSSPSIAGEGLTYNFAKMWGAYGKDKLVSREDIEAFVSGVISLGIDPSVSWGSICSLDEVYNGLYYLASSGPMDIFSMAESEERVHGRLVYMGYPSIKGSVHLILPQGLVGISVSTKYADKCWEFIRELILPEVQKKVLLSGRIPVSNEVVEFMYQSVLDPKNVKDKDMTTFVDGHDAVSEDVVEDFRAVVDSIDTVRTIDWGAYNIICEEIASYYTENRSVEQIAETLDTRLSLYVQENYQ